MSRARLEEDLRVLRAVAPDAHTVGAINGDGIDTKGFRSTLFFLDVGTVGTSVDAKVQESSDDGDTDAYSDVSGSDITQITVTEKQVIISVNSEQTERFLRLVVTAGGTEDLAASAILGNAESKPAGNTAADEIVNVH